MADNNINIDDKLLQRAAEMKNIFGDIVSATAAMNRAIKATGEAGVDVGSTYRGILSSANKVAKLQEEAKVSSEATKKIRDEITNLSNRERELTAQINTLMATAVTQTGDVRDNTLRQAENLSAARDEARALSEVYADMAESSAELDKSVQRFSNLNKVLGKLPVIGALVAGPFKTAEEAARKAIVAGGDYQAGMTAGNAALMASFKNMLSPLNLSLLAIGAAVKFFKMMVDLGFALDKELVTIQKTLATTEENAKSLQVYYTENARLSRLQSEYLSAGLLSTKNQVQALGELNAAYDTSMEFSDKQVQDQILLTKQMGLSVETATRFNQIGKFSGKTTEEVLDLTIKQTSSLARNKGLQFDIKKVTDDVAKVQGQLFLLYKGSPELITAAVLKAKQLGLTLEDTRNIAKGLLDFESSISNELEAELLTGKDLNLEYARSLALQGKTAEAAEFIAGQVGTAYEFSHMNVLAQESLAAAANMTVDALANSLVQRENLTKLSQEDRDALLERVEILKANGEVEQANRLLAQAGDEETLKKSLAKLDAQQEFNNELEKMKDMFKEQGPEIRNMVDALIKGVNFLSQHMPAVVGVMTGLAVAATGVAIAVTIASAGTNLIPLAIIGGISVLSGLMASYGVGSGTSSYSAAKESEELVQSVSGRTPKMAEGGIVTGPTHAIIGEAGPEAVVPLTAFMAKFDKMNATLETIATREGTVYIDGNQAGRALAIQTYRS